MTKGIVMEVDDRYVIVLTESGAFVRIAKQGNSPDVGEEVVLPPSRRRSMRRTYAMWTTTVAAALLFAVILFTVIPGGAPPVSAQPVAYVSIEINPSVELGIDEYRTVVLASGKNGEAVKLLEGLALIGLPLERAVSLIMEAAEEKLLKGRSGADIIITSVVVDETGKIEEKELQAAVQTEVQRVIDQYHKEPEKEYRVTVWSAPKEVLEEAKSAGLSAGKMTFYLKAQANGVEVTTEELKQESIKEVVQRHNADQLLAPDPAFTKETIKQLLQQVKKDTDRSASARGNGKNIRNQAEDDGEEQRRANEKAGETVKRNGIERSDNKGNDNKGNVNKGNDNRGGNGKGNNGNKNGNINIGFDRDNERKREGDDGRKSSNERKGNDRNNDVRGEGKGKNKGRGDDNGKNHDRAVDNSKNGSRGDGDDGRKSSNERKGNDRKNDDRGKSSGKDDKREESDRKNNGRGEGNGKNYNRGDNNGKNNGRGDGDNESQLRIRSSDAELI